VGIPPGWENKLELSYGNLNWSSGDWRLKSTASI